MLIKAHLLRCLPQPLLAAYGTSTPQSGFSKRLASGTFLNILFFEKSLALLFILLLMLISPGCAGKRIETVESRAGNFILGHGFSIDAHYEKKLDSLVPGYKLLTVAIRNTSLTVIQMSAEKDRWILVDRNGKKTKAINTLRKKDSKRWKKLPEEVQQLVEYPESVPINYTATFNLFFPKWADLDKFEELQYTNAAFRKIFKIYK